MDQLINVILTIDKKKPCTTEGHGVTVLGYLGVQFSPEIL